MKKTEKGPMERKADSRPLLTVQQVADLLQVKPRTVYKRQKALGGFKPAGMGCLRFDPEFIDGILLGPRAETLAVSVQAQRDQAYRKRIQEQKRFRRGGSSAPKGPEGYPGARPGDPFGLLSLCKTISPVRRK